MNSEKTVRFDNVSKFYGDVLGVNRVTLEIPPGVTSLVGPNGSGKTTLMNLITGLVRPTRGSVQILGMSVDEPEALFRRLGYCTQFDSFPKGITGRRFIEYGLRLHGLTAREAERSAESALERVQMIEAADRKVAGYSKGMRQRIRLAQAISHDPDVLILDEPLNGLDPMARADSLALFSEFGRGGKHVIISSHILHEVDQISDRVILLSHGYVMADGEIRGVRAEVSEHPMQVLVRGDRPAALAARLFAENSIVEGKLVEPEFEGESAGLLIRTRDAARFYLLLNEIVSQHAFELESVVPADDNALAVYQYLVQEGVTV